MKISTRTVDSVTVVDLQGRLMLGDDTEQFRTEIRELIQSGLKNILLNMGNVGYIDSSGVGELVRAYASVTNQGGQLKLLNLTKKLHDLSMVTKLLTVFEAHENEKQAIESFRG